MPKNDDFHKVTLNLRVGDWEYLTDIFAARGYPTSVVVRNLVAKYVDHVRAQETAPEPPFTPIDL